MATSIHVIPIYTYQYQQDIIILRTNYNGRFLPLTFYPVYILSAMHICTHKVPQ